MRTRIVAIGDRMPAWIAEGFSEYARRMAHEMHLELIEIASRRRAGERDPSRAIKAEGAAVLAAIPRDCHVVALDGAGNAWSSEHLARQLDGWRMQSRDLALLIGGADGHDAQVLARADQRWSLGPLTLPHMLVRVLVAEQLYRAVSILSHHPYHRG